VKITFVYYLRDMNFRSVRSCQILLIGFALCFSAQGVTAAPLASTISFVGVEPGTAGSGYAAQNWSNPGIAKAFDLKDDIYGSSGYYQIRPIAYPPSSTIYEGASLVNDLGISTNNPTLYSKPVILSSITGGAGDWVNFNRYAIFKGPDGLTNYTQGGLSVPMNQGPYDTPSGSNNGYFGEAFSFTMDSNIGATIRVGVAVDMVADGTYAPNYVSLYNNSSGTVHSSLLTRDGTPDMAVFDVKATAGDIFVAALWQTNGTQSAAAFGLLTFDISSYDIDVASEEIKTNSVALGGIPAALVKTGAGTFVITNSNSYGGGTTISGGRLVATSTNALGDTVAALKVSGGAFLELGANIIRTGAVTFDGGYLSTSNGSSMTKNGGSYVLTNAAEIVAALGGTAGLTRGGAGPSILWRSNSYTGATVVTGGALRLDGTGNLSSSTTLQVDSGATFSMTGTFLTSNDVTVAGLTNAGIVYGGAGTLTVNAATNALQNSTGKIEGGIGLTLAGATQLWLAGSNSYTGSTTIGSDNVLNLVDAHGLGSATNGTTVANGGVLRLQGTNGGGSGIIVGSEALTISGLGRNNGGGALRSVSGTNTWQGAITLAADARIGAASGSTLTLDVASGNAIEGANFNLTTEGAGQIQVNDGINLGTGGLTKLGTGSLILAGSNNYSGATTVNEGTLEVRQSAFTATILSNSVVVNFSSPPTNGTYTVLPGALALASLSSNSVTGLGSGKIGTVANSPNLVVQISDSEDGSGTGGGGNLVTTGSTFEDAYPGGVNMTDIAPNGLTYLVNYAFGGSSTNPAKLPMQDTSDPSKLTLVAYVRTNNASGTLNVVGEKGATLDSWDTNNPIAGVAAQDQSDAPSGTRKRIFSTTNSGDRLFLRLKTTLQP